MTIGDFINKLATQAGIDPANEQLVSVLSKSEIANHSLHDSLTNPIFSSLLTVDSAKNNETVRDHHFAQFMNGQESTMKRLLEDSELSDKWEEVKTEKGVGKKLEKLYSLVKDAEKAKASAKGGDKKEYEQVVNDLNAQIKTLKDSIPQIQSERDTHWQGKLSNGELNRLLSTYQYAGDFPQEVILDTAKNLVNRKLQEAKLKAEYNPEQNTFSLKTESGMEYFKDNSPVAFKTFLDSTLAENKMLKISGSDKKVEQKAQPNQFERQQSNGKGQINMAAFDAIIDEQIQAATK